MQIQMVERQINQNVIRVDTLIKTLPYTPGTVPLQLRDESLPSWPGKNGHYG